MPVPSTDILRHFIHDVDSIIISEGTTGRLALADADQGVTAEAVHVPLHGLSVCMRRGHIA